MVGAGDLRFYSLSYKNETTLLRHTAGLALPALVSRAFRLTVAQARARARSTWRAASTVAVLRVATRATYFLTASCCSFCRCSGRARRRQVAHAAPHQRRAAGPPARCAARVSHGLTALFLQMLQLYRCLTWSPPAFRPACVAVGQANGRVALAQLSGSDLSFRSIYLFFLLKYKDKHKTKRENDNAIMYIRKPRLAQLSGSYYLFL